MDKLVHLCFYRIIIFFIAFSGVSVFADTCSEIVEYRCNSSKVDDGTGFSKSVDLTKDSY